MYRTMICAFLLAGGLALAQNNSGSKAKDRSTAETAAQTNAMQNAASDRTFVMKAAIGGMAEVKMGELASSKGSSEAVKSFGQRMVTDHTKANDELKEVAAKQKYDIPTSLDAKHQATYDRLSKLSGAAFDRAYAREMVKDHDEDVKEFQTESQNGKDSAVRDFATKTLPTLQEHQKMAHDMEKGGTMKGTSDRSK